MITKIVNTLFRSNACGQHIHPAQILFETNLFWTSPTPLINPISETLEMTFEGLGEMFEGDSTDMRATKFPLVSMGGRADPGARTSISASRNFFFSFSHKKDLG